MKKLVLFFGLLAGSALYAHAGGATPVRITPTNGPCTVDRSTITASTSSWLSSYVLQNKLTLTSESTNFFWIGFNMNFTSNTGRGFYVQGAAQDFTLNENTRFFLVTNDAAGAKVSFTYCK